VLIISKLVVIVNFQSGLYISTCNVIRVIAMYLLNVYDAKEYGEVKRNQSTFDIENQLNVFLQINKLSCTPNVSLVL